MGTYYRAELMEELGLTTVKGRVLDIGGFDGFMLSRIQADEKVSVDIDTQPKHGGIAYFRGDGLAMPFADNSFDAVFALDILEHVDDEMALAGEILRVLKPGGKVVLTTPQDTVSIFPKALQPWANKKWQHYGRAGYSAESVRGYFKAAAAGEVRTTTLSTWWFLKPYLLWGVAWRFAPRLTARLLSKLAILDRSREGSGGYLLAEVWK
jgi:ubiquinone/menaquinone biosynthesis C-methylase UbiE